MENYARRVISAEGKGRVQGPGQEFLRCDSVMTATVRTSGGFDSNFYLSLFIRTFIQAYRFCYVGGVQKTQQPIVS